MKVYKMTRVATNCHSILSSLRFLSVVITCLYLEELAENNTDGSHDKKCLDSVKLNSLKILVFSKFPVSTSKEKDKAWRNIKGKINSKCRATHKFLMSDFTPPRLL